jgi:hypothetical protein
MNRFLSLFKKNEALLAAVAILLLFIAVFEWGVLQYTQGTFVYPVDDTFIHLAIAKNLVYHHIWGVTPDDFCSASSSILYPLLLAGLSLIAGPFAALPFWVNLAAGITFLVVVQKWLARQEIGRTAQYVILLILIFLIPLPVLIMMGMEHTLQLLICTLFIYQLSDWLGRQEATGTNAQRIPWSILFYGFLVTALRYEGVFLVGMGCLLLLVRGRIVPAILLGIIAVLPIVIFGLYSLHKGSYFLPNSVLVKSAAPPMTVTGLTDFFTDGIFGRLSNSNREYSAVATQRLLFILPLLYLLYLTPLRKVQTYSYIVLILIGCTFLHLILASTGWFFRYEAYLIGASIPISGTLIARYGIPSFLKERVSSTWVTLFLLGILVFPLVLRAKDAMETVCQSCRNIYGQQYQMARFLQKDYDKDAVMLNDIGAVCYLTEGKKVDLWGLGTLEVTRGFLNHYTTTHYIDSLDLRKGVKLAVIFDGLFGVYLTPHWTRVASWRIPDNYICAEAIISFYAVDSATAPQLKKNLLAFQPSLPKGVQVWYYR